MTKHVNADSIICGNRSDIFAFFRGRDIDDVDRLAQRALTIILRTDHLPQTGFEVDTDPFAANMFASAALGSINRTLTTYPFVRESDDSPDEDEEACFESAEELIEMAERLAGTSEVLFFAGMFPPCIDMPQMSHERMREVADAGVRSFGELFGEPDFAVLGVTGASFDMSTMEHAGSSLAHHEGLLSLTGGFLNDPHEHEELMAAFERSEAGRTKD